MTKKKKRMPAAPRRKKAKPAVRPSAGEASREKAAAREGQAGVRLAPAAISGLLAEATGSLQRGDLVGAERGYRAVLSVQPDHVDALQLLGAARAQAGQAQEAVELITRALELRPGAAEAHNNLGCAYTALKRPAEAMDCFRRAIEIRPGYFDAQRNLARALLAASRLPEAIECLKKVVKLKPDARAYCDLGKALKALGRAAEAGEAYRKAVAINPRDAEAHYELGNALATLGQVIEAAKAYRQAIVVKPAHAGAHNNLGNVLRMAGHYEEAIASYESALAITPKVAYAPGMIWSTRALICDWRGRKESLRRMTDALKAGEPSVSPFVLVGASDDPADQLACAADYVRRRHPGPALAWRGKPYRHDRIRVAYVSADFRDHPVAWLIAGLIEQHDRKQFETFGISLGAAPPGAMRERLKAGFEHFVDVRSKSDGEVAALLREREVDIAVDLMGHTTDCRPGIYARRSAPVQVGYLGFPGTTGAGFIDYILADAFVIPEDQRIHYSEQVACLPHCYLPHDNARRIMARTPTRAGAGLPERGFVFCCFNTSIKIAPESFDVWMRLLRKVDGSVLWLAKGNPATEANLRRETQARGVDPARLVFAPRVHSNEYHARYRLADLFLDTMTYNAHSTAVDVLWAGLPILTCPGRAFASRVCASALRAAGLPELIAATVDEYEARALELATRPDSLRAIRDKLAANRPTAPLFDTDRFRRHIESAYRTMWEISQRGEPPRAFKVEPLPPAGPAKARREEAPETAELQSLFAMAFASHKEGDLPAAERGYRAVLAKAPEHFRALHLLGAVLAQAGRAGEAVELISRAIALNPAAAEPHNNLGHAFSLLGRTTESMECYRKAIALKPGYADPHRNLGKALYAAGQYPGAVECFQKWAALKPGAAEAHFNLGNALLAVRRGSEAIAAFDKALAARPSYPEALNNRGNALQSLRRMEEAVATYDKALVAKPAYPEALNNRANALLALHRYGEAAAGYEAALALDPAMKYAAGMAASCRAYECDWSPLAALQQRLLEGVRDGKPVAMPLIFLSVSAEPADQLACAVIHARDQYPAQAPLWCGERYRHDRIRVAYLSGDFRDHPVAWLSAELFEGHDRSGFETYGISFGPPVPGAMRERMKGAFEHFIDVRGKSDATVAAALRKLEIDIAVDLMGYTEHSRPRIFARRPAPVQVNYLGFPATMGAEYMDYILADRFVIPESEQRHYSERVAYLPHCYLPTTRHPIAEATPSRAAAGLPERGFVYCCFNNTYKINPAFFDIWMRVLRQVEGSVLWLSPRNPGAVANLKREAQARGIAPERLVFARRVDAADYLARLRLADLFLDTTPYNAHTTASDVLWAGVPVLTCAGSTFAGRVAGSLLGAVGLPELITQSLADYEALAIELARQPQRLAALKQRLAAGRGTAPLFDTDRFRRHIESAYRTMWEISQRGEPPRAFAVAAEGQVGKGRSSPAEIAARVQALMVEAAGHYNRGDQQRAAQAYASALEIDPGNVEARLGLGNAHHAAGNHREAIECFRAVIAAKPDRVAAHFNLGNVLSAEWQTDEAVKCYRRTIALDPGHAKAHNNLGHALLTLHRAEDALEAYRKAAAVKPDYADAHNHIGNVLQSLKRHEEALAGYEAALALDPAMKYAAGMAASCRAYECDWSPLAALQQRLLEGVRDGKPVAMPLIFLSVSAEPADQLACAVIHARDQYPAQAPLWCGERYRHDRIRVAYLSGDFRDHPVAWLSAELFEGHDRSGFETYGISFGPPVPGAMRERMKGAFEHFIDVRGKSDATVAAALRKLEIDIAVDLMGYTEHSRPRIFARRPAPVQVNYLGFPATMGAEYMDYILADRFVIPESEQRHYSERVAYLPHCYLPTTRHPIAEATPSRAAAGLPERGFVYCCFNNTYKINPAFFDIWMRVLRQVEGSVLWLSPRNPGAVANLKREAQARGIAPERLVFARRVDAADYLARLRLADLFLDTTPYNAHTTASDVLWAGVPVLTCAGSTFAGRVAGSLLGAVGLPELITQSLADYEALAIELARQPQRLAALKQRLAAGRGTAPLFDTDRFRRHIESAYRTMWEISQRGEPPRAFSVDRLPTEAGHGD